ncbi:MAG: 23S rRNA (uracil(1939)-C(5))-methyltransferase RlmD, partial [Patescibacteria group bacterium]
DFYTGDVAKVLPSLRNQPSLIVVDPPRAGLTEKLIKQINDFGSDQIIYVSCNPSTLARDCNWLKDYGYKLQAVQPVDMFPHTYHIESVCFLKR